MSGFRHDVCTTRMIQCASTSGAWNFRAHICMHSRGIQNLHILPLVSTALTSWPTSTCSVLRELNALNNTPTHTNYVRQDLPHHRTPRARHAAHPRCDGRIPLYFGSGEHTCTTLRCTHQQKCKNILRACRYCLKCELGHGNVKDCTAIQSSQSSQSSQSLQDIGRIARDFGVGHGAPLVCTPIQ